MIESTKELDLISFDEMSRILQREFKATPDEIRYWIKAGIKEKEIALKTSFVDINDEVFDPFPPNNSYLFPYYTDLIYNGIYLHPEHDFFYPECFFYDKQQILKFEPLRTHRFVYQKDLSGMRNWSDYKNIYSTLLNANEKGILKFYHKTIDSFTLYANDIQLWCHTFEGEAYASNPESFFMLFDIINIERIFFNKDRNLCLEELHINSTPLPPNVYKIPQKTKPMKESDYD